MPAIIADDLSTVPFSTQIAAAQTRTIGVDMAAALAEGETFTTATTTLRNLDTGAIDADLPAPTVAGTTIVQVIDGAAIGFAKGETYELVLIAEVSETSRPARRLYLRIVA
jgi:hypothetical protein